MMTEVSTFRLYLLRAGYLVLVLGLGSMIWPAILHHTQTWELAQGADTFAGRLSIGASASGTTAIAVGIVFCMLGAMSALALLGLRYPLQMLPLLFFELTWKSIWLLAVALPLWAAHQMDAAVMQTTNDCLLAVIFLIVIPWRYVFDHYVKKAGDSWGRRGAPRASAGAGPAGEA